MYLKSLEIQGFKSFPDKTVLNFGEDITAIVGPNGSGKSNISDAIRWVMGEQSTRTLRGSKMEDVIFGGTEKRAQVGFAQVTLVIDNTGRVFPMEESEVAVTRRYYRSGESEYYINRQAVRLRDVNELFMDTGMGHEGYSIIGQGKIDELLSVKSGERRGVFEEAAGISKYRHRKEDAERKLLRTEENLLRINDKIAELTLQIEPLRDQSEKAKRYLLLHGELRSLEVSVWVDQLMELQRSTRRLATDLDSARCGLASANEELSALYQYREQFGEKMAAMDEKTDAVRFEVSALESKIGEKESEIAVMQSDAAHYKTDIERIRTELLEQDDRTGNLREQMKQQKERIARIDEECDALTAALKGLLAEAEQASSSAGSVADEVETLRAKEAISVAEAAEVRSELSALKTGAENLTERSCAVSEELEHTKTKREEQRCEMEENRRALSQAEEDRASVENIIRGHEMRLESRRQKTAAAADRALKATMECNAMESRIRLLSEMQKEYEGFSKAVRVVMQAAERKTLQGIFGPVASLIEVEDAYTVAIETALGGGMQNIVVQREEDAKAAISYLKQRDGGRATFLPISAMRGDELREQVRQEPGFVGVASTLVRCEERYQGVFRNLLGRTVVVEDLNRGIAMARKFGSRFRIVTLDGQIMNRGGSMTGGSVSRSTGVLTRANELNRLQEQLTGLRRNADEAAKEQTEAERDLRAASYELEVAEGQKRQAEDAVLRLKTERERDRVLFDTLQHRADVLLAEQKSLMSRLAEHDAAAKKAEHRIEKLEQESRQLRQQALEKVSGHSNLQAKAGALSDSIFSRREEMARLTAERSTILSALSDLERVCDDLMNDRGARGQLVLQYERAEAELLRKIEEQQNGIAVLREQGSVCRACLEKLSKEKLAMEAERTRKDRESREKNEEVLRLERETARLEQKKATTAMEEKQILDKLWDTYELSYEDAKSQSLTLASVPKANRRIGELRREINSLGTPNLGAIEEFERVNTRYEYLTAQSSDVQKAKADLLSVIKEITGEMKQIFKEQFTIIDESFRATFLELFGGGQARLELEDENDILNCGIEIKVQPPGKSLKTISLLSGGEKAFVAIALYFAILKVHPTPFCVMDEIEAALDEANVVRYAKYMRRIAGKTQFIVITHRRGTMEEADVLYGVTMQERGVSRVLTINLNDMARELELD